MYPDRSLPSPAAWMQPSTTCQEHRERVSVEVFPLVEAFAVEEQLPAVGDFGLGEGVVFGAAGAEAGCDESRREERAEQSAAWVRFH